MEIFTAILNRAVTAVFLLAVVFAGAPVVVHAQGADAAPGGTNPVIRPPAVPDSPAQAKRQAQIDRALRALHSEDPSIWRPAQEDLQRLWAQSGSPALDLLLERARQAIDGGHEREAIGHLTALIDHAPDFAEAYNMRAEAYARIGMFGPAVADLGRVLTLNPEQYQAIAGLGAVLELSDRPKAALEAYRRSLAVDPHQPSVEAAIKRLEAATGQDL